MKTFIAMLLIANVANAFVPAVDTRRDMKTITPRERIESQIKNAALQGAHMVVADADGLSWSEEKALMKELQSLGYTVAFHSDAHVYGWNAINGALLIKW